MYIRKNRGRLFTVSDAFFELVDALVGAVGEVGETQGVEPVAGVKLVEHVCLSPATERDFEKKTRRRVSSVRYL